MKGQDKLGNYLQVTVDLFKRKLRIQVGNMRKKQKLSTGTVTLCQPTALLFWKNKDRVEVEGESGSALPWAEQPVTQLSVIQQTKQL